MSRSEGHKVQHTSCAAALTLENDILAQAHRSSRDWCQSVPDHQQVRRLFWLMVASQGALWRGEVAAQRNS